MRLSTSASLLALAAPIAVSAAPFRRSTDNNTLLVLQFAHTLEQLETNFYQQALSKFQASDFTNAGFTSANIPVELFTTIQVDESTHVGALESLITSFGEQPLSSCQFDFTSVLTDVTTMLPVARLVENVGVSAYLGAAHLIEDPIVLSAAASIATIEARHQTILNIFQGGSAIPQAFDLPMLPQEILAIAGPFISGCDLGVTANAALSVTNTGPIGVGTLLQFSSPAINGSTDNFHCQMMFGGLPISISLPLDQCIPPSGINGPVAIWITSDDQPLPNNVVDRGSNAIVAGPLMTFIDTVPEEVSALVRSNGTAPVSSTATISPSQASSIISSVSGSPTASSSSASSSAATPSASSDPSNNAQSASASSGPTPNGPAAGGQVIVMGISMVPIPTST
ncbi:ferritin-like domain-containing protein [Gloeopeniophorella convolvens]|nr:ferritin-like domain-containing protein [Gloeopeniophorella convolvens]